MGIAGVKIKVMPTSPEVNLEELKEKIKTLIESKDAKIREQVEEPVAFGLKSITTLFEWDEEKDSDSVAEEIRQIENVNSAEVTDVRRLVQ